MEIFLTYLKVFVSGGIVCMLGQILINKTNKLFFTKGYAIKFCVLDKETGTYKEQITCYSSNAHLAL